MRRRVAIITGISKGIGRATAIELSKLGISIVGSYFHDDKNAGIIKELIIRNGGECILVKGDIKRTYTINNIINRTIKKFGYVDYLINNASHYERLQIEQITTKCLDNMLRVNIIAPFQLIKKVVPFMKKQRFGKIVNISSSIAITGYSHSCHYTSAKAGLIGLTKSLALELAPFIRVNCIAPGFINTTLLSKDSNFQRKERLNKIPLKSIGKPTDVAKVICFLLSNDSNYITGEVIRIAGGY